MLYLAYLILIFALVQLLVSLVNILFFQPFPKANIHTHPLVSVLIPARNEEKNITTILDDLKKQHYDNLEIIVFDDQSDDRTSRLVKEKSEVDKRISLIISEGLPDGWLGKNYACHSLTQQAKGEFLLFLDADVRVGNKIIINTISFLEKYKLALLSVFPKQNMLTWGEKLTVPNMNFILLSLLPLILVRASKFPSLSAANGQFMLFRSSVYHKTLPHQIMRAKKVEDIEIAKHFKRQKLRIACLAGNDDITCRMYENFTEAVNGFSRNVIMFFGNSFPWAILFWLITTFGFIVILTCLSKACFVFYIFAIILTRVFISVTSKQNTFINLLLIIPQQLSMGLFIFKAMKNRLTKGDQWKGRNIS